MARSIRPVPRGTQKRASIDSDAPRWMVWVESNEKEKKREGLPIDTIHFIVLLYKNMHKHKRYFWRGRGERQ